MDFNQISCFISVARTLNFSEAARQSFVSQSTVSRYIGELEKEFGVKLFVRNRRDVMLTNEGKALLPYAIEIMENLQKAKSAINRMNKGGMGKISITFDAVSGAFAKKCLKQFSAMYPDIAVELQEISGNENSQYLSDTAYDFHFMLRDMLPENDEIRSVVTHTETLSLICPNNFPIKRGDLKDLQGERFVLLSENVSPILYMEIMDIFRTCHLSPSISCYDSIKSVMIAVSAGLGISVLPTELVKLQSSEDIASYEIDMLDTNLTFVAAYRKGLSNPAANLFLSIVKDFSLNNDYKDGYDL
ncbi:LysR family transcriptional regulator [bacterium]|nr:LysR family transcriptional regulator [bacterium]